MIRTIAAGLMFVAVLILGGQPTEADTGLIAVPVPTPENAVFTEYKGVSIGMAMQAVRQKLGDPREKSDAMDLYIFSDDESAQFFYDNKTVNAIMITYAGDLKKAPTPTAVFGHDVGAGADGGIFKMIRDPKAGFWISYNRTAGDGAVVSLAMQKL